MRFKRIYIEITNVCNLNCPFCPPHKREKRYMKQEEFQYILKQIQPYSKYIYLHVKGEPLLHPQVDKFIQDAYHEGFHINLTTNATLLKKHLSITQCLRQINISLHATNSQEIIDNAKTITNTIINYRVWNKSINHEAITLLENAYQISIPDTKNFTLKENVFVSQEELFEWPDLTQKEGSNSGYCHALSSQIAILVDGSIVPCCLDHNGEMILGNIFQDSLEEVLHSTKFVEMQQGFQERKMVQELCKKCTFKNRF